ncbi:MAG: SRPBCC family protein [Bacteroidales bacterium]|nr:SRPBCC family protein [Bacteroidales bacterium]
MAKVESKEVEINSSAEKIFNFLSDFTNFSLLVPDKVENWKATKEKCSFKVTGLTDFGMEISNKTPFTSIVIVNNKDISSPFPFTFNWEFDSINDSKTKVRSFFNLDINPMMSMMVKKPLQNFMDVLVDKLKEKMENNY